jgi:hypothetical protein
VRFEPSFPRPDPATAQAHVLGGFRALLAKGARLHLENAPSAPSIFRTGLRRLVRLRTRFGPLDHARLHPARKIPARGRSCAKGRATATQDGATSGSSTAARHRCPVSRRYEGHRVLIVTEPPSARTIWPRAGMQTHVKIPAAVCINKWDLNPEQADGIEAAARTAGATPVGRVRYDRAATAAQRRGLTVVEAGPDSLADEIRAVWNSWMNFTKETP